MFTVKPAVNTMGGLFGNMKSGGRSFPIWIYTKGYFEEETFSPDLGTLRQFDVGEEIGFFVPSFSKEDEKEWREKHGGRIFREWDGRISFWMEG
jgi:hypothetical protein